MQGAWLLCAWAAASDYNFPNSGVTRMGDTRGDKWGCHPSIFSLKNLATFFTHRCHCHYRFLLLSLGCHPPRACHPTPFCLSDLVSPLFFVNLPTIFFLRVSPPPGGCHPGRSPHLVTPLFPNFIKWTFWLVRWLVAFVCREVCEQLSTPAVIMLLTISRAIFKLHTQNR